MEDRQNPIPPELRSEHLFLLVGANPLPNWVAARLLLRDGGQVYLVHSKATYEVATRLSKALLALNYRQPERIEVGDGADPATVYARVEQCLKKIPASNPHVGLNYTGGTKVMSTYAFQAIHEWRPPGYPKPVFTYLDALTLEMRFEPRSDYTPLHPPVHVALASDANITIGNLFRLYEEGTAKVLLPKNSAALPVAEAILKLHETKGGFAEWARQWSALSKHSDRASVPLFELPSAVAAALANGHAVQTIGEVYQERIWPFESIGSIYNWFVGGWLEDLVVDAIRRNRESYHIVDYGKNLDFYFSQGFHTEIDVAAVRGYQLHFISCYTGDRTPTSKLKLMEVFVRAHQMGGDEAAAALVCMSDEPRHIEKQVEQLWQGQEVRVKVFGRADINSVPKLDEQLYRWFQEGLR